MEHDSANMSRDSLDISKIMQSAYLDPTTQAKWRLDFRYDDANGNGLTFFDGAKPRRRRPRRPADDVDQSVSERIERVVFFKR